MTRLTFSIPDLVHRNLRHYWRTNLAVVFGCAVAVAALAGSLLVGDSVRGTLHDLALERLGRVQYTVTKPGFFREQLATDLRHAASLGDPDNVFAPAIITQGVAENTATGITVPEVAVLGVTDDFLKLAPSELHAMPQGRRVILNQTLAGDLAVSPGDSILLTVGRQGAAPMDTIFARRTREQTLSGMRLIVDRVIPSKQLGAFNPGAGRARPRNLYILLSWLQARLGREGKANTIPVAPAPGFVAYKGDLKSALAAAAQLDDYDLRLTPNPERGYLSLESERFVLPGHVVARALQIEADAGIRPAPTSVYLADMLALRGPDGQTRELPYAVVASAPASDQPPFGPLPAAEGDCSGRLSSTEILLNAWAAEDLGAKVGDTIEMMCYVSDETGRTERAHYELSLRGIVALAGPALDKGIVPAFEGVTDATNMVDWDAPFPFDSNRIRDKDEAYWREHGATPKAYVAHELLKSIWLRSNPLATSDNLPARAAATPQPPALFERWITSVRIAPEQGEAVAAARKRFTKAFLRNVEPLRFGFAVDNVRENALRSAKGSSDFGLLFVSMSIFIVAASAGLVGLLFRLTIERRASQYGILMATGFEPRQAARVLLGEGVVLAIFGVILGTPFGIGYAHLIIMALRTSWAGATGNTVFTLHVTPASLIIGGVVGFAISIAPVFWALRLLRNSRVLTLLFGWRALVVAPERYLWRRSLQMGIAALVVAAILLLLSGGFKLFSPTAAFFGGGALLLLGLLALLCAQLQRPARGGSSGRLSLWRLGWRSASRNWVRSLLTCGLIACACFVVVAVAANQRSLSHMDVQRRDSGSGGFSLLARSTAPIHVDLNSLEGRKNLAFPPQASQALIGSTFHSALVSAGDDISCLNIQQPGRPRILGVANKFIARGGFVFSSHSEDEAVGLAGNPWRLLEPDSGMRDAGVIPAIADAASAQWILKKGLGEDLEVVDRHGNQVCLRLVGLLANSVFQSEVVISESAFRKHFDANAGYRHFLIETPPGTETLIEDALRKNLGEHGFDVQSTAEVLAGYAKVQDTYLHTFQTLGGLGLMLGTFGIVTVLLRSVVERRSELAILLALGLRRGQVVGIILIENGFLLLAGTIVGSVAALVAVAPHLASAEARVNWLSLGGTLLFCVAVGLLSCGLSAAVSVRAKLLSALRSE